MSPFLTRLSSFGPNKGGAKAEKPVALTNGTISGSSSIGSTLTYTTATFSGTPIPSVSWAWYRSSSLVQTGGSTYTLVPGDNGNAITVRATAINAAGSVIAISNSITAIAIAPTSIEYLVVAGGGGGGYDGAGGGGGGAGGLLSTATYSVSPGSAYTIQVGGGGGAQGSGSPSYFGSITATGGGSGGPVPGTPGGSGGGGNGDSPNSDYFKGGNGIPGQGNPGGSGIIFPFLSRAPGSLLPSFILP